MTIKDYRDKFKAIDPKKATQAAIEATQRSYIELQKSQLYAGFTVAGTKIGDLTPYKSPAYAIYKANKNPLPGLGNPDLYDEGNEYDGITTEVGSDRISVFSTDSKDPDLQRKYPGALAGLGGPFKAQYIKDLQPVLIKQFKL